MNELIETEVKLATEKKIYPHTPNGPGKRLHAARMAANIPIESVALALHLTTKMVMDLENDHYQGFAGHTFIRGYLRNYARLLGLSADEIIASFNNLELIEHESDKPKLALKTSCRKPSFRLRMAKRVPLKIGVVLLLILAGWYGMRHGSFTLWHLPTTQQIQLQPEDVSSTVAIAPIAQQDNSTEAATSVAITLEHNSPLLTTKPLELPKATVQNVE